MPGQCQERARQGTRSTRSEEYAEQTACSDVLETEEWEGEGHQQVQVDVRGQGWERPDLPCSSAVW